MADELLEQQRTCHEQIDRLRKDAVKELASVSGRPVTPAPAFRRPSTTTRTITRPILLSCVAGICCFYVRLWVLPRGKR